MKNPIRLAFVALAACAFATAATAQPLWDVQFASATPDSGVSDTPQSGALILGSPGDPAWNLLTQSTGGSGIQINDTTGSYPLTLTTAYNSVYNNTSDAANNLMNDFASAYSGAVNSINVAIAGLTPGAQYELVLYSAGGTYEGGVWTANGGSFGATTATCAMIGAGPGVSCLLGAVTADGSGSLTLNGVVNTAGVNSGNQFVSLNGFQLEPLIVTSSLNPSPYGAAVALTANYAGSGATPTPTGTVTFEDGATVLGASNLIAGVATFTTASLPAGVSQTITAVYSGDSNYPGSTNTLPGGQTVNQPLAVVSSALWDVQFASATPDSGNSETPQSGALILGSPGDPAWNLLTQSTGGSGIQINDTTGNYPLTLATVYNSVYNNTSDAANNLMNDFASAWSGGSASDGQTTITVAIAGLTPNAQYELVLYSAGATYEGGVWAVNGGSFGATTSANNLISSGPGVACLQGVVTASAGGSLTLYGVPNTAGVDSANQFACLNGFQLEPLIVTSSLNPSPTGAAVTFTANYAGSGATPTPTGTVTFYDGATVLGASNLIAGVATLTTASLPAGPSQTITAVYSGDSNYPGSTNTLPGGQTVNQPPAVALSALWDVQFASATPDSGTSETPQSGALILGSPGDPAWNLLTQSTGGSGIQINDTTGNYPLTLTTVYNSVYNNSTYEANNLMNDFASAYTGTGSIPSISVAIAGLTPNAQYELVLYSAGGAGQGGIWTVNGGSFGATTAADALIASGPGVAYVQGVVTASDAGSLALYGVPNGLSPFASLNGFQLEPLIVTSSLNPSPSGAAVTFTANYAGIGAPPTPTGTVTFYDGATVLGASNLIAGVAMLTTASLPAGSSQTITAVYSGDSNYPGSTNTLPGGQTVNQPPAVALSALWDVQFASATPDSGNSETPQSGALILGSPGDPAWNLLNQPSPGASGIQINDTTGNYPLTISTVYNSVYNNGTGAANNLMNDWASAYSDSGNVNSITVAIAGLTPNVQYELVLYSAGGAGQGGIWTVNGSSFGTTTAANDLISSGPGVAYLQGVVTANASGALTLYGVPNIAGVNQFASLNGFQLEAIVPLTVTSSASSSIYGAAVTLTATYAGSEATPTGTVTFYAGTNALGTGTLNSGVATLTTSSIPAGSPQTITAVYSGEDNFAGYNTLSGGQTVTPRVVTLSGAMTYDGQANIAGGNLTVANNLDGANLTVSGVTKLAGASVGSEAINYYAPLALVQSATGNSGSSASTTIPVTLGAAPVNGNTLIAVISTRGTAGTEVTSISQTGATWTKAVSTSSDSHGTSTEIWYAPNVSSAGTSMTINQPSLESAAVVMEYSGLLTVAPLDQTKSSTGGSSTSATTGTTTATTQAGELWIGGVGLVNSGYTLASPLNSFATVANTASTSATVANNAVVYALAYNATATGTASSGGTVSTSSYWSGAIATFKLGGLALAGSAAGNYTLTGTTGGSVTVTPKALTMSGLTVPASKPYDGTTTAVVSGTPALAAAEAAGAGTTSDGKPYTGDTVSITGTASGTYNSDLVASATTVTFAGLSLTGAQSGDYTLTQQTAASATIAPRVVTLSGSGTYNGTASMASANLTIGNNLDGVNLTLASGSVALAGKSVGSEAINYYATPALVQSATGNAGSSASTTIPVTLGTAPVNGNTLIAVISTRGTAGTEVTSISQTGATWTKAVSTSSDSHGTSTEIWYAPNVSSAGTSMTINQPSLESAAVVMEYSGLLTVAPLDQTKSSTGGSSTSATTGTTTATTQAGELWIGGVGLVNSGYTLASPLNSFATVANTASTSATAANNAVVYALAYDATATGTANSGGTVSTASYWSGAIATFKAAVAGSLTLGGSAAGNYTVIGASGLVTVSAKTLTMSGLTVPASKPYDGTATAVVSGTPALQTAEAAGTGSASDGAPYTGDAVSITGTASGTYNSSSVPSATTVTFAGLSLTGAQTSDYSFTIQSPAPATITPATLTYNATPANQAYGSANTVFSGSVTGFVPGDNLGNATTGGATFASMTTTASPVGSYAITGAGLTADNGNYNFAQAGGNATALTVGQAPVTVTANSQNTAYGAAITLAGSTQFTSSALSNSETIGSVTLAVSGPDAGSSSETVGTYTITPGAAAGGSGTEANYSITYVANTLTVNPLAAILTEEYDGTTNTATPGLLVSNVVGSDNVNVSGSGGMASADIGTNAITSVGTLALGGTAASNYSLGTSVIVTPLPVSLTGTRLYDGTNDASSAILTIETNYDDTNLTLSGSATLAGSSVGLQNITGFTGLTLGGTAASNYTLANASGSVTITVVTPVFSGLTASQSITYGTPTVALGGTVSAVGPLYPASGETITVNINGNAQTTTVSDSTGDFSLSYNSSTLPAGGTAYTVAYSYAGDDSFTNADDSSTALTVNPLAVVLTGTEAYNGAPTAAFGYLSVLNAINGDNVNAASGNVTLAGAGVGLQSITDASSLGLGGANAGNYTVNGASGSVTITNSYAPFSITSSSLDITGTNVVVCWQSVPGVVYNVLTNTSLAPPQTWTAAGSPITATNTTTCVTLPGGIGANTNVFVVIQQ